MLIHSFYRLLHKLLIFELHHTVESGRNESESEESTQVHDYKKKKVYAWESEAVSYPQP